MTTQVCKYAETSQCYIFSIFFFLIVERASWLVLFLANAKVTERASAGGFTFDLIPGDGGHCECVVVSVVEVLVVFCCCVMCRCLVFCSVLGCQGWAVTPSVASISTGAAKKKTHPRTHPRTRPRPLCIVTLTLSSFYSIYLSGHTPVLTLHSHFENK